jgi:hypothetical protein
LLHARRGAPNPTAPPKLTEADQIWFNQQVEAAAAEDDDLREVAAGNTEENFDVFDVFDGIGGIGGIGGAA